MFPNDEDKAYYNKNHPLAQVTREEGYPITYPMNTDQDFPMWQAPFFYTNDKVLPAEILNHMRPEGLDGCFDHLHPIVCHARPGSIAIIREYGRSNELYAEGKVTRAIWITDVRSDGLDDCTAKEGGFTDFVSCACFFQLKLENIQKKKSERKRRSGIHFV